MISVLLYYRGRMFPRSVNVGRSETKGGLSMEKGNDFYLTLKGSDFTLIGVHDADGKYRLFKREQWFNPKVGHTTVSIRRCGEYDLPHMLLERAAVIIEIDNDITAAKLSAENTL